MTLTIKHIFLGEIIRDTAFMNSMGCYTAMLVCIHILSEPVILVNSEVAQYFGLPDREPTEERNLS